MTEHSPLHAAAPKRVLVIGCGYIGTPLAAELVSRGHEVLGLTRTAERNAELQRAGIRPLVADIRAASELARLPNDFDWVVNLVASAGGGADEYRALYLEGTRNVLAWLKRPQKFVYTSSTSVYGQTDGSLVDETAPTEPLADTAQILLKTEAVLKGLFKETGFPAVVLRVAAICGPQRGYWFKQFLSGEAVIEGKGERWLNMVHRDDLVRIIMSALEKGQPGQIYNVVDDQPVQQKDFFTWLAQETKRPLPLQVGERPGAQRKRGTTNKRVSNAKLKNHFGYQFLYPTFREGYRGLE